MNPLTNVKNIQKLNQLELELGAKTKTSWHNQYRDSAWVFIGGLPYDLTEGDILAVFSQYGEIVNINLVRDKATGKSKGFAFLCFEDQRSTILTVDNLNSTKILGRTLRVDHCENYRRPKETGEEDDLTQQLRAVGCAPKTPSASEAEEEDNVQVIKKIKKEKDPGKKKKKVKKDKKRKREKGLKVESESDSNSAPQKKSKGSSDTTEPIRVKKEKVDPGYDKYANEKRTVNRDFQKEPMRVKQEPEDTDSRETTDDHKRDRVRERGYGRTKGDTDHREQVRDADRNRMRDRETDRHRGHNRDNNLGISPDSMDRDSDRDRDHNRVKYQVQDYSRKRERESDRMGRRDRESDHASIRGIESYHDRSKYRDSNHDRHRGKETGGYRLESGRDREHVYDRSQDRDHNRMRDEDHNRYRR